MSLYDKYHSDININYMYDLLTQILNKDIGEDISNNDAFKKIFTDNSKQIFTEVNSDVLEEINKVLLDKHIFHFTNLLQLNKPKDLLNDNSNMDDRFNDLIQSRNIPLMKPKENTDNSNGQPLNNGNPFLNLQQTEAQIEPNKEILTVIEEESSSVVEFIEDKPTTIVPTIKPTVEPTIVEPTIKYPEHKIFSSKRSNIQSSRFHYTHNLLKNDIKSSELKKVTKIVIPIEDNYIFSSPILFLKIKELNVDISLELDHVIEDNSKKYGYYKSLEDKTIELKDNIEKITIDIRDVSETRYDKIDIAKVNVIEIKDKEIQFTCTNIEENNYSENDYIKIINNYTKGFKLNVPLKILRIEGNKVICPYDSKITKKITDVDMKLLNTSNQNIIYFN